MQLEGIVLPPACTGAYPFESEVGSLTSALGLLTIAALCYSVRELAKRPAAGPKLKALAGRLGVPGRIAMTGAVLLFPLASTTALALLNCPQQRMNAVAASTLDGGSAARATAVGPASLVTVRLLDRNPFYVCWSGRCVR